MDVLHSYWALPEIIANGLILLHLIGALLVGVVLGYERSYHGRAAGMRTYVLVCLTSTALTVINSFPELWYGGAMANPSNGDPTRVVQGILAGMGFLGAGVIMRDGLTIRGLSTAASLWLTAGIGVLIGVGFYAAAISATLIAIAVMSSFRPLERLLPHKTLVHLSLSYALDALASRTEIDALAAAHGYDVADWSATRDSHKGELTYHVLLIGGRVDHSQAMIEALLQQPKLLDFSLAPARN